MFLDLFHLQQKHTTHHHDNKYSPIFHGTYIQEGFIAVHKLNKKVYVTSAGNFDACYRALKTQSCN